MQPRVGSWATPTEVDAVAIPVSEGRAPGPPAESEKERLRREMNAYRMAFWERRFVACMRGDHPAGSSRNPFTVLLSGDLGAGKTACRGLWADP